MELAYAFLCDDVVLNPDQSITYRGVRQTLVLTGPSECCPLYLGLGVRSRGDKGFHSWEVRLEHPDGFRTPLQPEIALSIPDDLPDFYTHTLWGKIEPAFPVDGLYEFAILLDRELAIRVPPASRIRATRLPAIPAPAVRCWQSLPSRPCVDRLPPGWTGSVGNGGAPGPPSLRR